MRNTLHEFQWKVTARKKDNKGSFRWYLSVGFCVAKQSFLYRRTMTTMTTVLAVVQCQEWGDETRKIRINFPKSGAGGLSFTGRQLHLAVLSKVRQMLGLVSPSSGQGHDDDDGDRVEIYDSARECFVCLKDFDLWGVDIAPRFGRLVRCIAHLTADEADSSFTNTNQQSSRDQTEQTPSSPLAIMGRYFHYDPNGMDYFGKRLIVKERSNDLEEDGTGLNIWDGAILLANYLELHQNIVQGKRVLELGSGPGFVGIAAGLAGALEVVMTDLSYCIPLMNANVERNMIAARSAGCQRMTCSVLDWYCPPSDSSQLDFAAGEIPDVILVADCVWLEELVAPLVGTIQTILQFCAAITAPRVIISYQRRGKGAHDAFMKGLQETFDEIEEVSAEPGLNKPDVMHIFECKNV